MSTSLLLHHKYVPCWKHCFPWIESDSTYACAYECHSRRFLLSSLALAEKLISSPPSPASGLAAITERPFSLLFIFHLSLLKSPWIHLLGLKAVCLQGKKKKPHQDVHFNFYIHNSYVPMFTFIQQIYRLPILSHFTICCETFLVSLFADKKLKVKKYH